MRIVRVPPPCRTSVQKLLLAIVQHIADALPHFRIGDLTLSRRFASAVESRMR